MTDQPTSDTLSRASAYLDGELIADELAAAEADPAVMAEVTRLRSLQQAIRDVDTPTSHARDTAIAAALAEFDHTRRPADNVRSRPRPAYTRWLAVAAAVAGLAALGAVIATNSRGHNDIDTASEPTDQLLAVASDSTELPAASAGAVAPAAPEPEASESQVALATGQTGAPAATTSSAEADAALEAAPATTAAAAEATTTQPAFNPSTPIPDVAELGRAGRQLLAELAASARVAKSGTPCDGSIPDVVLLSDAVLIVDGTDRPVLIAGNPTTGDTFALDPDTCVIVASGQ